MISKSKKKILDTFEKDGFIVIKNFFKKKIISDAKKEIFEISKKIYKSRSVNIRYSENKFDFFIKDSLKKDSNLSSKFYDISKKFLSMHKIAFDPKITNLAKILLRTKNVGILNRAYGYRLDRPDDEKFLTQLHQDYIQNLGAPEGLVFYNTLRDVNKIDGPVIIYKGSHKLGIAKVLINKKIKNRSKAYILDIPKKKLNKFKKLELKLKKNDLAVFNFFLLHKSSPNKSKNIRWSMVSRYFDFNSSTGIKNLFPGGLQENNFFEKFHYNKISKVC
jgi:ectoine hydroxylase-related dioxygenase (phytanoyl-CoA dioxygenase family)